MKPIKVICPICGKKMIPKEWGKKKSIYTMAGQTLAFNYSINYVNYVCSCGNRMKYKGTEDCWRKCKCKKCGRCNHELKEGELRYTEGENTYCKDCKKLRDEIREI